MSSTVAKALTLLDHFSEDEPELGLSDLARRSGADKATVHRMLTVMADSGLVEQRADTRLYRLGAAVLRLARIRETAFPITSVMQKELESLAALTGETAHASLISGRTMATIGVCESAKGNRVSLQAGEVLQFHSTASGLAVLSAMIADLREAILSRPLISKTPFTITDVPTLRAMLDAARQNGFAEAAQSNELEVHGIAAPIFDPGGLVLGAVAVAAPSHRMNAEIRNLVIASVLRSARAVTAGAGGKMPGPFVEATARTLSELAAAPT
jgi:DNA-binding IclR family transcriptional regulator